ncbi:MAG TPA: hypothetical protein VER96_10080, partial [Polyangiaceae bacterium]|nr:hypothetical protein [Polyangiaceae bacterium]
KRQGSSLWKTPVGSAGSQLELRKGSQQDVIDVEVAGVRTHEELELLDGGAGGDDLHGTGDLFPRAARVETATVSSRI